jgi:hypothetical protein
MFSQVASQLAARARWLLSGQIDKILAEHAFPLPVDFGDSRLIIRTPEEGRMVLGHLRAAYAGSGVNALMPTITAIDLPRGGRLRIWADWHTTPKPGGRVHLASVVYYCRQTPCGLRIEMLSCVGPLIPDLSPELAALALSA